MGTINKTQTKVISNILKASGEYYMPKFLNKREWLAAEQLVARGVLVKYEVHLNSDYEEGAATFQFA